MAPVVTITEAELLEALAASHKGTAPEDARTVAELVQETGIYKDRIRRALNTFKTQGRLAVHSVVRRNLDGRFATVPAYTIAPAKKATKHTR